MGEKKLAPHSMRIKKQIVPHSTKSETESVPHSTRIKNRVSFVNLDRACHNRYDVIQQV